MFDRLITDLLIVLIVFLFFYANSLVRPKELAKKRRQGSPLGSPPPISFSDEIGDRCDHKFNARLSKVGQASCGLVLYGMFGLRVISIYRSAYERTTKGFGLKRSLIL